MPQRNLAAYPSHARPAVVHVLHVGLDSSHFRRLCLHVQHPSWDRLPVGVGFGVDIPLLGWPEGSHAVSTSGWKGMKEEISFYQLWIRQKCGIGSASTFHFGLARRLLTNFIFVLFVLLKVAYQ